MTKNGEQQSRDFGNSSKFGRNPDKSSTNDRMTKNGEQQSRDFGNSSKFGRNPDKSSTNDRLSNLKGKMQIKVNPLGKKNIRLSNPNGR